MGREEVAQWCCGKAGMVISAHSNGVDPLLGDDQYIIDIESVL